MGKSLPKMGLGRDGETSPASVLVAGQREIVPVARHADHNQADAFPGRICMTWQR